MVGSSERLGVPPCIPLEQHLPRSRRNGVAGLFAAWPEHRGLTLLVQHRNMGPQGALTKPAHASRDLHGGKRAAGRLNPDLCANTQGVSLGPTQPQAGLDRPRLVAQKGGLIGVLGYEEVGATIAIPVTRRRSPLLPVEQQPAFISPNGGKAAQTIPLQQQPPSTIQSRKFGPLGEKVLGEGDVATGGAQAESREVWWEESRS